MSQAWLAGIHSVPELAQRTGIPRSTIYRRLEDGTWSLAELRALDRAVQFDDEAKIEIMEGKR